MDRESRPVMPSSDEPKKRPFALRGDTASALRVRTSLTAGRGIGGAIEVSVGNSQPPNGTFGSRF